jgi:Stress responsive A/B Barrel Domain
VIRHVALINLKPDAAPEARGTIVEELRKLPSQIPTIREYDVGVGLNPGNASVGIVASFDDADAFVEYRDHPAHRAVSRDHIVPAMDSGTSIQFEV